MDQKRKRGKKVRISILRVLCLAEGLLAIVLAAVFFWCGIRNSRPEAALEKYCSALQTRDWNTVYDLLNLPNDGSLSRRMFVNARRYDNNGEYFSSYTYEKSDKEAAPRDYETWYGTDPVTRVYNTEFTKADGSEPARPVVLLVKTGKKFFLFDEWKVSPVSYLVLNTGFTIPLKSKMTLNGVEIMVDQREQGSKLSFGIPYLFKGWYQLEVSMDGMESYRESLPLTKSNSEHSIQLLPASGARNSVLERAEQDIQKILESALTNKSFGTVSDLFHPEALKDGEVQAAYNALRQKGSTGEAGVTWVELTGLQGTLAEKEPGAGGEESIVVNISGHAKERFIYMAEDLNALANGEREFDIQMSGEYSSSNGQWKLLSMPVTADML